MRDEIEGLKSENFEAFKEVKLPVARIKKIMKSDQDVRMISIEAPILFSKACEMFITELTHKALFYARRQGRKQIQRVDLAQAVTESEVHDFLLDLVPEPEMEQVMEGRKLTPYQKKLMKDVKLLKLKQQAESSTKSASSVSNAPTSFGNSIDCPSSSLFQQSQSMSSNDENQHTNKSYPSGSIHSSQNDNNSNEIKQDKSNKVNSNNKLTTAQTGFKKIFVTKTVNNR